MKLVTQRQYRLVIPPEMLADLYRVLSRAYLMAPVFIGEANREHAAAQFDAVIKEVAEKDGLLAAVLTQDMKIEINTITKDMTENTIEFNKELISYSEFLDQMKR